MKYWIGIGVSVILLALFLLTVDVRRMLDALGGANYWYVIPAAGMYFVSVYFRSMRWSVMLRHLKPVSTRRLFPVVVVGYMANNLLPMRLGELVRSYYLSEREGVSATSALVTVFVERIFDALALLFLIAIIVPFAPVTGLAEGLGERLGIPPVLLMLGLSLPFIGAFAALILLSAYPRPDPIIRSQAARQASRQADDHPGRASGEGAGRHRPPARTANPRRAVRAVAPDMVD